jgi:ATP-dependent exoDNAse (exonuclease V) beta subunit
VKVKEQLLLDFDSLDAEKSNMEALMQELKKQERAEDEQVEYETEIGLKLKKQRDEVYRKFSMLCVEMKFLYVAITRPKRRLIIYDDAIEGRKPIQNYWEKLNVVEIVTKDQI